MSHVEQDDERPTLLSSQYPVWAAGLRHPAGPAFSFQVGASDRRQLGMTSCPRILARTTCGRMRAGTVALPTASWASRMDASRCCEQNAWVRQAVETPCASSRHGHRLGPVLLSGYLVLGPQGLRHIYGVGWCLHGACAGAFDLGLCLWFCPHGPASPLGMLGAAPSCPGGAG